METTKKVGPQTSAEKGQSHLICPTDIWLIMWDAEGSSIFQRRPYNKIRRFIITITVPTIILITILILVYTFLLYHTNDSLLGFLCGIPSHIGGFQHAFLWKGPSGFPDIPNSALGHHAGLRV